MNTSKSGHPFQTPRAFACLTILSLVLPATPLLAAEPAATPATPAAPAVPAAKSDALFTDPVVAKGKGIEIKRSELDAEVIRQKAAAAAQGMPLPADVDAQLLDQLIKIQLIMSKATPEDRAKGKADFELFLKRSKADAKLSDAEFEERLGMKLRSTGQTRETWEKQNVDQATLPAVLLREIKVTPTEADAKKYYDENPRAFEEPETVRVSHILIRTADPETGGELSAAKKAAKLKQIEDIQKRAKDGEDWNKLVKENSEDPGSKSTNGEYTFSRGRMVKEFEETSFLLQTNQISEVVTTSFGYHIIKGLEHRPAHKEPYAGLETVTVIQKTDGTKVSLKERLTAFETEKEMPTYVNGLRKEANVQILDDSLKLKEPSELSAKPGDAAKPKPDKN